jgi:hypothetical protein
MSITVHTTPATYTPCYNGQWFVASSTNIASTNFTYTVVCTDVITSATNTQEIEQRPDGKLVFDGAPFAKNYVKNFVPNNQYGFQPCVDAIRKMRVRIGETYGTPPTLQVSGTNNDYYVWNGVVNYLDFPSYSVTDYVYNSNDENVKYLTILEDKNTFDDKSLFLYALTSIANDIGLIRIKSYDAANTLLGTSDIANPYVASTNYLEKYLSLDIGKKGLDNIASGLVTGTYPILGANCSYYTVEDVSTLDTDGAPYVQVTSLFTVTIKDECQYTPYIVHYLSKKGDYETINFSKVSEQTVTADKTYYRKNPYELNSNVWAYDNFTAQERVLNSSTTKRIRLNTDWLNETEAEYHQYLVSSPSVYIDFGSTIGLIPIKVTTNNWVINKKWNKRLYNVTIDIEYTFKETYQNG